MTRLPSPLAISLRYCQAKGGGCGIECSAGSCKLRHQKRALTLLSSCTSCGTRWLTLLAPSFMSASGGTRCSKRVTHRVRWREAVRRCQVLLDVGVAAPRRAAATGVGLAGAQRVAVRRAARIAKVYPSTRRCPVASRCGSGAAGVHRQPAPAPGFLVAGATCSAQAGAVRRLQGVTVTLCR